MSAEDLERSLRALCWWRAGDPLVLDDVPVPALLAAVDRHRLVGVLGAAVRGGAVELRAEQVKAVSDAVEAAMAEALLLEDVLLEAVGVLAGASVDLRVLKGSALAHTAHPDPSHRSFGDNDILVRGGQIDDALEALVAAGARRPVAPLSRDFDRRFAKSVTLRWSAGTELDVHRTLVAGPFGVRIETESLWGPPATFSLAGTDIPTLAPGLHLIHALYHVALGDVGARYGNLRDVGLLLEMVSDLEQVVSLIDAWRGRAVVAEADRIVQAAGGSTGALGEWARRAEPSARDVRCLATYRRRRSRFGRQAIASLGELPLRDRPAFARALVFPSRAHRVDRGKGGRRRWRRLARR